MALGSITAERHIIISETVAFSSESLTDVGDEIILDHACPFIAIAVSLTVGAATTYALDQFAILVKAHKDAEYTTYTFSGTNNIATLAVSDTESASIRLGAVYSIKFQAALAGVPTNPETVLIIGRATANG